MFTRIINTKPNVLSAAVAATCLIAVASANASSPPPGGYRVYNAVEQFNNLALHGDPIGFHLGVGQDPDQCRHYQGMTRINGPDGTPYFMMTRSGNHTRVLGVCSCGCADHPGELLVVEMASRPRHGERLRSNKLSGGGVNMGDTVPPTIDRGINSTVLNGDSAWMHPGGGQEVDGVYAVAVERPWPNEEEVSAISFYDVRDPASPSHMFDYELDRAKTGIVGMTKDPVTGKYLIVYTGGGLNDGEGNNLYFEESDFTDFFDNSQSKTFTFLDDWHVSSLAHDKWEKWQSANFIREEGGALFLGMADNTALADNGDNWIRLFQVSRSGTSFSLEYRAERKLKVDDPDMGNAAAGAGFYVSPTGELIFYLSEHDNDGAGATVKCGEFRSINVSRSGRPVTGRAWIEFYWDTNGWNDSSPNRSIMLDQADWSQEDWHDMDEEAGWGDAPDSLRFWVPPGGSITIYKDQNFSGDFVVLDESFPICPGEDEVRCSSDLGNFGDAIHSVQINARTVFPGAPNVVWLNIINHYVINNGPDLAVQLFPGTYFENVWAAPEDGDVMIIEPVVSWLPVTIAPPN